MKIQDNVYTGDDNCICCKKELPAGPVIIICDVKQPGDIGGSLCYKCLVGLHRAIGDFFRGDG